MSHKSRLKPTAIAIGATFAGGLVLSQAANADDNPFGMTELSSGYQVAASHKEGKCGGEGKSEEMEGKAGKEGKCGEGKCGEGKCGEGKGAHTHGEDGDAAKKEESKGGEGKCGEGKCGG